MCCLLVRNQNTRMLEEEDAEEMEELGIYADEVVEFRCSFWDLNAEMHCHPSIQLILLFAAAAKCGK